MSEVEHVHKLKLHKYRGGTSVYFCVNDCNFKIDAPLALGKFVTCWICLKTFQMTEYSVRLMRPHCSNCSRVRVTDSNGKSKLVKKEGLTAFSPDLAANNVSGLRERIGRVITMEKPPDEDI